MAKPLTIDELRTAYAKGLDPRVVVAEVFDAIDAAADPGIFISMFDRAQVLSAVEALGPFDPAAKPLWGVPFAVKDNIDVAGLPTTCACPKFAYEPETSATAVERIVAAGAIVIGKTNLDQFATGLVGLRTPYPVPRNAIDPEICPGGSSSGSATIVARGIVPFALGTDTAGSGRVPAAFNNIVGLKPSLGAISTRGLVPACRTLDCISVFALTVEDAWAVMTVLAAFDAADPYSRPVELGAPRLPGRLRIGIPAQESREFFGDQLAAKAFERSIADLAGLGAGLVEVDLAPFFEVASLLYSGPWVAERYQAIRAFFDAQPESLHPVTRQITAQGKSVTGADAFAGLYRLAELRRRTEAVWSAIDVLAVPSVPTIYTVRAVADDPINLNSRLGTYTNFVNLLDLCALAVPGRFRDDGRPAGATLIAPCGKDALLAALGSKLHATAGLNLGATGASWRRAADGPAQAPSDWVELVCVGAHMSGLPLNHELTDLGGTMLRTVRTEPCYKLYRLPGGGTPRPGLERVAAGMGAAIETEVWALPPEGFSRFVAAIPSPLGIATLQLADGTRPKGFVAEAAGLVGAVDISEFGGWRAYLEAGGAPQHASSPTAAWTAASI